MTVTATQLGLLLAASPVLLGPERLVSREWSWARFFSPLMPEQCEHVRSAMKSWLSVRPFLYMCSPWIPVLLRKQTCHSCIPTWLPSPQLGTQSPGCWVCGSGFSTVAAGGTVKLAPRSVCCWCQTEALLLGTDSDSARWFIDDLGQVCSNPRERARGSSPPGNLKCMLVCIFRFEGNILSQSLLENLSKNML